MAYKVFTSYAVPDRTKQMEKFMARLKGVLRTKIGERQEELIENLVFFDFKSIKAGDEWNSLMAQAVGESETLVCLVSPTYLNSPWCGRELEAFQQRLDTWKKTSPQRKKAGRFVFPVLWEPDKRRPVLPKKLSQFQFATQGLPANYRGGLRHLADLAKYRDAYKEFVERLADEVNAALASKSALPILAVDFTTMASAFDEQPSAYDLVFWPALAGGSEWQPVTGGPPVRAEVAAAAALMRVWVHPFQPEADFTSLEGKLWEDRQILLVVADARTPPDAALIALNAVPPPLPLALLLIDAKASPGQTPRSVADWLGQMPDGRFHRAVRLKHAASCLPGNIAAEIEKIATNVRVALINNDDGTAVQNTVLENAAGSRGIATAVKANLTGSVPVL